MVGPGGGGEKAATGVTAALAALGMLVPMLLVAVTRIVYAVPLVRPVIAQEVVADVHVLPPGDAVAVYPEMGWPPVKAGALQLTAACPSAAEAATAVGADGRNRTTETAPLNCPLAT